MEVLITYRKEQILLPSKEGKIMGITGMQEKDYECILENSNRKVNVIKNQFPYQDNLYQSMQYEIRKRGYLLKNPDKKIKDAMRIVGLPLDKLSQQIKYLSTSEKKLAMIAIGLLNPSNIIIIEEPFKGLDLKYEKKIARLLKRMGEKYQKKIFLLSTDSEILYQHTDYMICMKKNQVIKEEETTSFYQDIPFLKTNKMKIPEINEITYLSRTRKRVPIDYYKDIRDVIKDIYKHS